MRRNLAFTVVILAVALAIWWVPAWRADEPEDVSGTVGPDAAPESMLAADPAPVATPAVADDGAGLRGAGDDAPDRGPVTVTVRAADGTRLPELDVQVGETWGATDARGEAAFADVAYDEGVSVQVGDPKSTFATATVTGPVLDVVFSQAVPIHVAVRDALTGAPVEPEVFAAGVNGTILVAPEGEGGRRRMVVAGPERVNLELGVTPPEGRVLADPVTFSVLRSPYADALHADVPLRRELDLVLVVRDHTGALSEEAVVRHVRAAGRVHKPPQLELDGFGNRHVRGVAFFGREPVSAWVELPGTTAFDVVEGFTTSDPEATVTLTVELPEPEPSDPFEGPEDHGSIGLGGSGGGAFRGRSSPPPGRLRVTVKRFNGEAAVGAVVRLVGEDGAAGGPIRRTDAAGVARVDGLKPGRYRVRVRQTGLLAIESELVEVTATVEARVTLRERRGAALELKVVDELGSPLPYATFELHRGTGRVDWPLLDGTVQRVDPFTDHSGVRRIPRLPPDVDSVVVRWGSRSDRVVVDLADGETKRVEIELPAKRGAPR